MYIHLKVTSDAKKELFKKVDDTHYIVAVKEPAERNQANKRVLGLVKEHLGASSVRLISGHHSGSKIVDILGVDD
ncbi:MAG: DUF167 domain-containing protein [Candidatus Paceibacterota bacterium]|jgi:uncharacterized protein YggU (UPF0235/DUF167 family)